MKYYSSLPASALAAVLFITALIHYSVIPPGMEILQGLQDKFGDYFFALIFLIILLESVIYVGFYFPGQFFAVVLVILSKPTWYDIMALTGAMVLAATLGSIINYALGRFASRQAEPKPLSFKSLLLAMIHINSLAFFMFAQGAARRPFRVVWLAGLLNLPYYFALILLTTTLSEGIMQIAESTWLLAAIIGVWLAIALVLDLRRVRQSYS